MTALDLTLRHNGKDVYRLLSGQSVRERIAVLFGNELAEDLLSTSRAERGMQIRGLMARPVDARASGKYQYLFLNGRFIRDKFILHAVKEGYRGLMEPNKYPVVFLFIEMPPEDYDVNVHPTKTEVRFDNANLVHSEVLAVLRDKLLSTNLDVGGRVPSFGTGGDDDNDFEIPPAGCDGWTQRTHSPGDGGFFQKAVFVAGDVYIFKTGTFIRRWRTHVHSCFGTTGHAYSRSLTANRERVTGSPRNICRCITVISCCKVRRGLR